MADVYKEGLALYKLGKIKEAMKKFAAVAKDHIKYGHAQVAGKKLKTMTSPQESMPKHTAEERQKIKEDRSKKLDKYYDKSKSADYEKQKKIARQRAIRIVISKPREDKKK